MPSDPPIAPSRDLLFSGEIFCDLVFTGVAVPEAGTEVYADAFSVTPGGTANRAVAAARLGARTTLFSRLGDDPLGVHIRSLLARERDLDLDLLETSAGHQSPVTVALTGAHDRSFITYQEHLPHAPLPENLGPVGAAHVGIAHPLPDWVAPLRAAGTTIVGGVGWDETGAWSPDVLDRLAEIDVFVPNDVEAMRYTGLDDPIDAAKALAARGPLAVVTCGSRGVVAADAAGEVTCVPAVTVAAVDPTGAGDVFTASFMVALALDWTLEQRLLFAGLCASLSVMSLGGAASAPTPGDLLGHLDASTPPGDWGFLRDWAAARPDRTTTSTTSSTTTDTTER